MIIQGKNTQSSHISYIALGSNLGDKKINLDQAVNKIKEKSKVIAVSNFYITKPEGYLNQDDFLNGVIKIKTNLLPIQLIGFLKSIEKTLKRTNTFKNGPRTIDLDILFYDNMTFKNDILTIPHPRLHLRTFVIKPFLDIDPNFIHPVLNKSILQIAQDLDCA